MDAMPFTVMISCSYRGKEGIVSLIGAGTGYVLDVNTERVVAKVNRWNGPCTQDGKLGIFASPRSGLEILELRHGSTVRVLLPKVSEGLVNFITGFTASDEYVYYYHNGKRTIRLFRVEDGEMIANYRLSAEARIIKSSPDGASLVVGGADGSLIMLMIADPRKPTSLKALRELPSRAQSNAPKAKLEPLGVWRASARLAVVAAKKEVETDTSTTCTIS